MDSLVFKIKYQETLRRWVVLEKAVDAKTFSLTLQQLESKIRDLFSLPATAPISITYVDNDNDMVTLGDDQDLFDACLVQQLNPLRLEVRVLDEKPNSQKNSTPGEQQRNSPNPSDPSVILESLLKFLHPEAARDSVRNVFQTFAPLIDPNLTGQIMTKVDELMKEVQIKLNMDQTQKQASEDPEMHIHVGVQCDRCGMFPIVGPRYNSKKVFNYDLCSGCFEADVNQNDYHKIERPAHHSTHSHHPERPQFFPYPSHLKSSCRRARSFQSHPACRPPFARGPYGWRPDVTFGHPPNSSASSGFSEEHRKLDARFVKDVTIFDGTELAPNTKFTKIWRVSNNGNITWPQGIQLIHIGGDSLCAEDSVNVQVPEGGLACGEDLEASIDLIAPEKAGRYVSHWRLASPSGQKFGHRLWVMIQVVPQGEQSPQLEESLKDKADDASKEEEVFQLEDMSKMSTEDEEMAVPVAGLPDLLNFKDDDSSTTSSENAGFDLGKESVPKVEVIVGASKVLDIAQKTSAPEISPEVTSGKQAFEAFDVKSEVDGFSVIAKPTEWFDISANDAVDISGNDAFSEGQKYERVNNVDDIQKMHLESLESMGFTNQKLNVLLLKKNDQNLQMTVDDLLTASGWDGALKDLEDMGFTDQAKNIQLLVKNKGSIKLVVKELVKMEKLGK